MSKHHRAARFGLLLLLACQTLPIRAQTTGTPGAEAPWIQVELIAFRHRGTDADTEKWPAKPALSYPPQLRFLLEPGSPELAAALEAREFEHALQAEAGSAAPSAGNAAPEELPGVLLPGQDSFLADAAARIAHAPGYTLLAHVAWREPRLAEGTTENVLLTGGGSAGDHRELEGFVSIVQSRFLHVETRLWLNDFTAPGKAPGPDAMELPPIPRPVLPQPQTPDTLSPAEEDAAAVEPVVTVEPVRAERTVLLQASRRIALGEVHYLDHPLLGLIVAVRSYDPAAAATAAPAAGTAPAGSLGPTTPAPKAQPGA